MSYMFANAELFRIRKRKKDGIRQAQMSGRFINRAPFGYTNFKDQDKKGLIAVDDERAILVQKIFRDYLDDVPVFEIYKEVRSKGFNNSGNSAIPRILSNPIYAGLVKVNASKTHPQ